MQNRFSKFYDFDECRQHILLLKLLRIFSIFLNSYLSTTYAMNLVLHLQGF